MRPNNGAATFNPALRLEGGVFSCRSERSTAISELEYERHETVPRLWPIVQSIARGRPNSSIVYFDLIPSKVILSIIYSLVERLLLLAAIQTSYFRFIRLYLCIVRIDSGEDSLEGHWIGPRGWRQTQGDICWRVKTSLKRGRLPPSPHGREVPGTAVQISVIAPDDAKNSEEGDAIRSEPQKVPPAA